MIWMKRCVLLIILVVFMLCMVACGIQCQKPQEGVWYCKELKISVDFSVYQSENTPDCAKLYNQDGTQTDIRCYFDYGTGVFLVSKDQETEYLNGKFRYSGDVVIVTSYNDGTVYTFVQIDE